MSDGEPIDVCDASEWVKEPGIWLAAPAGEDLDMPIIVQLIEPYKSEDL